MPMTAFPRSSGRAIEKWFGSPASPSDASTPGMLVTVDDRRQRAFVLGYQVMDHHECWEHHCTRFGAAGTNESLAATRVLVHPVHAQNHKQTSWLLIQERVAVKEQKASKDFDITLTVVVDLLTVFCLFSLHTWFRSC